jgi:hypothetical protein
MISMLGDSPQNHLVAEVQCIPPVQRRSAYSSRGLFSTLLEITEEFCETKRYPFGAQRPHAKFRASRYLFQTFLAIFPFACKSRSVLK